MEHGHFLRLLENEPHKIRTSYGRWGVRVERFSALGNGTMENTVPFWRKRDAIDFIHHCWVLMSPA